MSGSRFVGWAAAALATCVAIACTINPQPLPPSADLATDASFPREDGAAGAFGDSGGGSSSGGSSGSSGADGSPGEDAANPPPPEAGTDAASDAPEDSPSDAQDDG